MKKLLFFALLLINYQSPLLAKCIKGDCQNSPGIYDDSKEINISEILKMVIGMVKGV